MADHKPVLLLGGGGHATVVLNTLLASERRVIGFLDSNPKIKSIFGLARLGDLDTSSVDVYRPEQVDVANGLGSIGDVSLRYSVFTSWKMRGFQFVTLAHPESVIGKQVELGEGVQIMAGAVVQPCVSIGENSIVNTRASVDHNCTLGAHVHIAPGATLSGDVTVGDRAHIGTGAVIVQGISIGQGSIVGAGSVVVKNVDSGVTVAGVPARRLQG